ncbi:SGNH/GDSL hydrolase family protein [Ruficoccus sp. ZRK36]|uniref:SGNH/GDSL hydrolase family protein n=1 Tax=Ruficoccus sp. ZRK36 TaxID=2866311 RepID=UPI001C72BF4D|nr:SGNH/GDSL hydrolase family protein [Ruficoccus sp. ZRK36]QYY37285.1 SGNH/GDSL hydrolase family protein [Ruficoccus sp. ZRK36]
MKKISSIILACLGLSLATFGSSATPFEDGDRIAFIGASITHAGTYHWQLQTFYATRYPYKDIVSRNFGVAGDSASGVLKRFDWDIKPFNPNRATVNIGLNDIGYWLYEDNGSVEENEKERRIDSHLESMDGLVKMLTENGVRPTLITLTPVDETGTQARARMVGVNEAIKSFSPKIKAIADKYDAEFIDITGEMERINIEEQKDHPDFTLIGPDRVHPRAVGHLVMAYLILKAQGVSPIVSTVNIDATQPSIMKEENCDVTQCSKTDDGISFTCLAKALPFPVSRDAQYALELVPFTEDLNQEVLTVSGLKKGDYELSIDGEPVLYGSADIFAAGVNLAVNEKTPQYRQAVAVKNAVYAYADLTKQLRNIAKVEHGSLFDNLTDPTIDDRIKCLENEISRLEDTDSAYRNYYINLYKDYIKIKPKQGDMLKEIQPLFDRIYSLNKPVAHTYTIKRLSPES